ncbi:MAG: hypothetical protein AB7G37_02970 [Solirubrobacteraceae bacterium]
MDWSGLPLDREVSRPDRRLRVAVVQLAARPDGPERRLALALELAQDCVRACEPHVVVLPDLLTGLPSPSVGIDELAGPHAAHALERLRHVAAEAGCAVSGGFIAARRGAPRSVTCLAESDGRVHLRDEERPAPDRNGYVRGAADDGYASTATVGVVGLVSGHDWWRSATPRRLRGGVGLLLGGGSCRPLHVTRRLSDAVQGRTRRRDAAMAVAAVPLVARQVGAPAVVARELGDGLVGESQIVAADGRVLRRLDVRDGDAWAHADLDIVHPAPLDEIPIGEWAGGQDRAFRVGWMIEAAAARARYRRARRTGGIVASQHEAIPDGPYLPPFGPDETERNMIVPRPVAVG